MAAARDSAIVLAGVHVLQVAARSAVGFGDIFLFNVGMEGIDQ